MRKETPWRPESWWDLVTSYGHSTLTIAQYFMFAFHRNKKYLLGFLFLVIKDVFGDYFAAVAAVNVMLKTQMKFFFIYFFKVFFRSECLV